VSFDERGDSKGRYNIMNYRRNRATRRYEYVTVGRWADRLSMDVVDYGINRITWAGGTAATFVLFCSLAFLDPRVGHTMDVLSPFISILRHSD